ncbi:unnamed protein product, partial [Pleuronectes platessa]
MQKYREEWEKANTWVENVRENIYKAHCTVCRRTFSVAHGGLTDLKPHASSGGHMLSIRDNKTKGTLDQFVVHQATPEADMEFTAFFEKCFDFSEENWLFQLQPLSLASGKIFDDMENITNRLCLVGRLNISMDDLYEECVTANSLLEHLTQEKEARQSKGTAERWMEVLQAADLPNIQAA